MVSLEKTPDTKKEAMKLSGIKATPSFEVDKGGRESGFGRDPNHPDSKNSKSLYKNYSADEVGFQRESKKGYV